MRGQDGDINSTESLRILGFNFSNRPDAVHHVTGVIKSMYGKLWTLRFLKRSGMSCSDLLKIYKVVIRSAAEYCSVVYHSLIPAYMSAKLEQVQRQAVKIIYGWKCDYGRVLEDGLLETLEERREKNCLKFALKCVNTERFGRKWFPYTEIDRDARSTTRRVYRENVCRTDRERNNPIQYMLRALNANER